MSLPEGAIVHIIEAASNAAPIIPDTVLINGVDVGLLKSYSVDCGDPRTGEPARVTLELYPREIVIGGGLP